MIIEKTAIGIGSDESFVETARIMDEMDRLLNEMQETMKTIKQILDDENHIMPVYSTRDNRPLAASRELVHGS